MDRTFEKWHSCENDFLLFLLEEHENQTVIDAFVRAAPRLCTRTGSGIGADGLLLLRRQSRRLTIVNADGSLAEHCGNGVRCCAALLFAGDHNLAAVEITLGETPLTCMRMGASGVGVHMGSPQRDEAAENSLGQWRAEAGANELSTAFRFYRLRNPHLVITDSGENDGVRAREGAAWQKAGDGAGINVHWWQEADLTPEVQKEARRLVSEEVEEAVRYRTWERGCGFTASCGSGASCVAARVFEDGFISASGWLGLTSPGGTLFARQAQRSEGGVFLVGPTSQVFRGTISL